MVTPSHTDGDGLSLLLGDRNTLICAGPGGVGKTTTAAALAVHAARHGKKVLVLTIDPAKRLANSLGLASLGNRETEIDPALFTQADISLGGGSLHAMMLDVKTTFDELIARHAPSHAVRERILRNPFYQQASTVLAGSQEYMAMEKLYEIRHQDRYDLVILDTPPTANALDFLSAPDRLADFLSSGAPGVLIQAAKHAGRGIFRANRLLTRGLSRFMALDTFTAIMEFIGSFQEMYDGFRRRAAKVQSLFRSPEVGFLLVSSTEQAALDEVRFFHANLTAHGMPFAAMIVNRVRTRHLKEDALGGLDARLTEAAAELGLRWPDDHTHSVVQACRDHHVLARVDEERIARQRAHLSDEGELLYTVPLFAEDIHDVGSLARFAELVFA